MYTPQLGHVYNSDYSPSGCDYHRPRPCDARNGVSYTLDTSKLTDGRQPVCLDALDATDENVNTQCVTVSVDNHDPGEPLAPTVEGGQGWHTTNGFNIDWTQPGGQAAPVTTAFYELCKADGTECHQGSQSGENITRLSNIQVPAAGEYSIRVWLGDAAGNADTSKTVALALKFDGTAPGQAQPERRNGWVNASEATNYVQVINAPDPSADVPASGIAGYAVTYDGSEPGTAINVCGGPERSLRTRYLIPQLREGVIDVKARAISGAGVAAQQKSALAEIHVDLTPPNVESSGAPDPTQWVAAAGRP